jgi:hypothetical protein
MTPTNDQIFREAVRRREAVPIEQRLPVQDYVIEVVRENWTPPEPVDPDVLAFREWYAGEWPLQTGESILAGAWDHGIAATGYLAGARMARERERERAKVLVEFVGGVTTLGSNDSISAIVGVARFTLAKYRGEA